MLSSMRVDFFGECPTATGTLLWAVEVEELNAI
jgi:hypothetical protein